MSDGSFDCSREYPSDVLTLCDTSPATADEETATNAPVGDDVPDDQTVIRLQDMYRNAR